MTYIIDDSSVNGSWTDLLDRKAKYIILYTSDELQHFSDVDQRVFMTKGIKSMFIRCFAIEDLYMQIGFLVGQASAVGGDVVLISDSKEYDKHICSWRTLGICVTRKTSC